MCPSDSDCHCVFMQQLNVVLIVTERGKVAEQIEYRQLKYTEDDKEIVCSSTLKDVPHEGQSNSRKE